MRTPRHDRGWWACCVGAALMWAVAGPAGAQTKPFPDEWFFDGAQRPAALKSLEGKPAPALTTDQWIGDRVSLPDQRGRVVVVDFWATWCGPCMAAIPENVAMVKKYADKGLVFVGVHDANSGWDQAASVVKDKGINYSVAVDAQGGPSAAAFKVPFWPTYVVIDRGGIVRGAGLMPNQVENAVKLLLAENAPAVGAAPAASEFGPEFYLGGESRPSGLRLREGAPAPAMKVKETLGRDGSGERLKGNVVVVYFLSPVGMLGARDLAQMVTLDKEYQPQGVQVVGVCDARAPWVKMEELAKSKSVAFAVLHDEAPEEVAEGGRSAGLTAGLWGVEFFPASFVVDRDGVVRAAGVKAEKVKAVVDKLLAEPAKAAERKD